MQNNKQHVYQHRRTACTLARTPIQQPVVQSVASGALASAMPVKVYFGFDCSGDHDLNCRYCCVLWSRWCGLSHGAYLLHVCHLRCHIPRLSTLVELYRSSLPRSAGHRTNAEHAIRLGIILADVLETCSLALGGPLLCRCRDPTPTSPHRPLLSMDQPQRQRRQLELLHATVGCPSGGDVACVVWFQRVWKLIPSIAGLCSTLRCVCTEGMWR